MTSVIKVDTIQNSSGASVRSGQLGIDDTGTIVKTTLFPKFNAVTLSGISAYSSGGRGTYTYLGSPTYDQDVTVVTDNPILLITGAINVQASVSTHTYFDFLMSGDMTGWLSEELYGSTGSADGLIATHNNSVDNSFTLSIHAAFQTSLTAGDTVTFKPAVASWAASTIYVNMYPANGNINQLRTTTIVCQEIKT